MIDKVTSGGSEIWLKYVVSHDEENGHENWFQEFEYCGELTLFEPGLQERVQERGDPYLNWVEWEIDGLGLEDVVINDGEHSLHNVRALAWLLRQGIAPGQPFLVRFSSYWAPTAPGMEGDYEDPTWDAEVVAVGKPPADVAEAISYAWGLKESEETASCLDPGACDHKRCFACLVPNCPYVEGLRLLAENSKRG